jgi:uncharacterized protein YndB with AHSA1/START domain
MVPPALGAVAQLGERRVRNAEVRGSIPLCSTEMTGEVRLVQSIRAPRADLWSACSTVSGLEGWYADRVTGNLARGGSVRLAWPDLSAAVDLDIVDWVVNERLVFANGQSKVTLEIREGSVGLCHEGLADDDDIEGFHSSWRVALAVLAHALESHGGSPRRTRWAVRPARTSATLAHACFTEPAALSAWFGPGAVVGAEGELCALALGAKEHLTGRVLVRSGARDVAYSWKEQNDSVLILRTLPSSTSDDERILAACWSKWGPTSPGERAVENELKRALERLAALLAKSGSA